jgi:hypothetical protein
MVFENRAALIRRHCTLGVWAFLEKNNGFTGG